MNKLRQWFEWWQDGNKNAVMEIRILPSHHYNEQQIIDEVKKVNYETYNHDVPIRGFGNSFFITEVEELIKILTTHKNWFRYCNLYYGVNPRRQVFRYSKKNSSKFLCYGKGYAGISQIKYIPFDIESSLRKGVATFQQLRDSLVLANDLKSLFLDKHKWNNFYLLDSGGGHHLVYKLDELIQIPEFDYEFDKVMEKIIYNIYGDREFNSVKRCINNFLQKINIKSRKHYNCNVDSVGDAPRIMRLPYSINWKGEQGAKVKLIEHNFSGKNIGLTTKLLTFKTKNKQFDKNFIRKPGRKIRNIDELRTEPLVKLLLTPNLPTGNRNHYLELSLAYLLRGNNFYINNEGVVELLSEIERVQGRMPQVDSQYLDPSMKFYSNTINNWCEIHMFPPVYELLPKSVVRRKVYLPQFQIFNIYSQITSPIRNIRDVLNDYAKHISKTINISFECRELLIDLNKKLIGIFGIERAKYYWNHYVVEYLEKYGG